MTDYAIILDKEICSLDDVCKINYLSNESGFFGSFVYNFRSRFYPYHLIEDSYISLFDDISLNPNDLKKSHLIKKVNYDGLKSFFDKKSLVSDRNHLNNIGYFLNKKISFENFAIVFDSKTGSIENFCNITYDYGEDSNLLFEVALNIRNLLFPSTKLEKEFQSVYGNTHYFPRNIRNEYIVKRYDYQGINDFYKQRLVNLKKEENILSRLGGMFKPSGFT